MRRARGITLVLGVVLLLATVAGADTHVGDWDVTGEITASGNFATFGDSSYVTPFSGWSGSSRMVAVRQPTAVSSGVSAGFMFSNNQTGNAQNIAQLMFLNEAIGAAEKRVAQILVQTGGTTNSGKMFFRVFDGGTGVNALTINRFGTVTVGDGLTFPDSYTQTTAYMGATSGGSGNTAAGDEATVGGGLDNTAGGNRSTVSGGGGYQNYATAQQSTIAGGSRSTAGGSRSAVGGGYYNDAQAAYATIAGGGPIQPLSDPTGTNNVVTDDYGTIGGGGGNQAGDGDGDPEDATYCTVGGGYLNSANGQFAAAIGGGAQNTAGDYCSTVGGGQQNVASGNHATVAGGQEGIASGMSSAVGGGWYNEATGFGATVPGGISNEAAGDRSFAAGRRATISADHDGTFLWADESDYDFLSAVGNEFAARATGGVRFVTAVNGSGVPTAGVTVGSGGGSWSSISARSAKENFEPVDGREVLAKVAAMPIETWNYKAQDASIRHIGPMAEDFRAAFGVGDFEKRITAIDADGVALAAIQGLNQKFEEKDAQIVAQQKQIAALQNELRTLRDLVERAMEK